MIKKLIKKAVNSLGYKISKLGEKSPFPVPEVNKNIKNFIQLSSKYSMTGELRMYVLTEAIKYISNKSIKGDLVECGVWRGGNLILMKKLLSYYKLNKTIYGYDTFEGMSEPTDFDIDVYNNLAKQTLSSVPKNRLKENIHCYSPLETVKKNIIENSNFSNINLIKGMVEESLIKEKNLPEKISLLRLDTDFYESTRIELEI